MHVKWGFKTLFTKCSDVWEFCSTLTILFSFKYPNKSNVPTDPNIFLTKLWNLTHYMISSQTQKRGFVLLKFLLSDSFYLDSSCICSFNSTSSSPSSSLSPTGRTSSEPSTAIRRRNSLVGWSGLKTEYSMYASHEQHVQEPQQQQSKRVLVGLALQRNSRLKRNPRTAGIQKIM